MFHNNECVTEAFFYESPACNLGKKSSPFSGINKLFTRQDFWVAEFRIDTQAFDQPGGFLHVLD